jgi:hypothetical protein
MTLWQNKIHAKWLLRWEQVLDVITTLIPTVLQIKMNILMSTIELSS